MATPALPSPSAPARLAMSASEETLPRTRDFYLSSSTTARAGSQDSHPPRVDRLGSPLLTASPRSMPDLTAVLPRSSFFDPSRRSSSVVKRNGPLITRISTTPSGETVPSTIQRRSDIFEEAPQRQSVPTRPFVPVVAPGGTAVPSQIEGTTQETSNGTEGPSNVSLGRGHRLEGEDEHPTTSNHYHYASSAMTILNSGGGDGVGSKTSRDPLLDLKSSNTRAEGGGGTTNSTRSVEPPSHLFDDTPTPILSPTTGRQMRNYQLHSGLNRFYLSGRLLTSSASLVPFLLCLLLGLLLPVLFLAASGPFLWHHLGGGGKASLFLFAWLAAIMLSNMIVCALRDPGILPRGLDREPEKRWVENDVEEGGGNMRADPRYVRIGDGVVATKWCETCLTYRPPRTSHCRLCDNCVSHTDHHCTFLNNCIGRRNYTPFIVFLFSSILCAAYAISFSAYHLLYRHSQTLDPGSNLFGTSFLKRWDTSASLVVSILAFLLVLPIIGLLSYHLNLLWHNRTTIEMLRPKGFRSGAVNPSTGEALDNIFSNSSAWRNLLGLLCRPSVESWIRPRGLAWELRREREEGDARF